MSVADKRSFKGRSDKVKLHLDAGEESHSHPRTRSCHKQECPAPLRGLSDVIESVHLPAHSRLPDEPVHPRTELLGLTQASLGVQEYGGHALRVLQDLAGEH